MDVLIDLARSPLSFALMLLAALVTLGFMAARLARARAAARVVDPEGTGRFDLTGIEPEPQLKVVDLRGPEREADIDRALAAGGTQGEHRERTVPLILGVGSEAGGKSTALAYTGLRQPFGVPGQAFEQPSPPAVMWSFERARVLDAAGALVDAAGEARTDEPTWKALLDRVARARRRRPADGMTLTVAAGELMAALGSDRDAEAARRRLADRAAAVRQRLIEAQRRLGMRLPVFVQITKCDLLPGFLPFVAGLAETEREQMIGWSNPDDLDEPYSASTAHDALGSVRRVLERLQVEALGEPAVDIAAGDRLAYAALPATVAALEKPLAVYLNQVFTPGAGYEAFPLRGVYLLGGEGFDRNEPPHRLGDLVTTSRADRPMHRSVDFLADLLAYKVFYEWNLAAPTERAARRARRRLRFARGLAIGLALVGPVLLWWTARGARTDAVDLATRFLAPATAAFEANPGSDAAADLVAACNVLDGLNRVGDYRLRRLVLVPSWGSVYGRDVSRATAGVERQLLLPDAERRLDARLKGLATVAEAPPPGALAPCDVRPGAARWPSSGAAGIGGAGGGASGAVTDLGSVPEHRRLDTLTDDTADLERAADRYGCFVPGRCPEAAIDPLASFSRLTTAVYGRAATPPSNRAESFLRTTLAGVQLDAPWLPDPEYATGLAGRAERLGLTMTDVLYRQNVVVLDLAALERQIIDLERQPPVDDASASYRRVLDTIDRTTTDLSRPEMAWAGRTGFDLGDPYRSLLGRIEASALLGPSVATPIDRHARAGFADLRRDLAGYRTPSTGPLLARDDDGNPTLMLSESTLALRDALARLLGEPFMEPGPETLLEVVPPAGTYLRWRVDRLGQAVALSDSYTAFTDDELAAFDDLESSTADATRATVERNMLDQVAQAQSFPVRPAIFLADQRERLIADQVDNLTQAQESLGRLLDAFTRPRLGDCPGTDWNAYCQLAAVLVAQKQAILADLETLLAERAPYATAPRLGGWAGGDDLAERAFGLSDPEALGTAVLSRRQAVQQLAEAYAKPVVEGPPLEEPWGVSGNAPFNRFKVILADLADAEAKTPDNAVELLESYIQTTMAGATAGNCLEATVTKRCFAVTTAPALRKKPPCDYFLEQRGDLARAVASRCETLTLDFGAAAYRRLADAFQARLAGRFPFGPMPPDPRATQAKPADVAVVLGVYDRERQAIENLLELAEHLDTTGAVGTGTTGSLVREMSAIRGFMTAMADVRTFFDGYLATIAEQPTAMPTFDLELDYRIKRERELGGNAIIRWQFSIDDRPVDPNAKDPASWLCDQPVALSLAWAKDGPVIPLPPTGDPQARLAGQEVIFAYQGNWSLIHLLRAQAAPPADLTAGEAATVLRFDVPTRSVKGDAQARVYMRLTLVTAGDDPVALTVPSFPVRAPALPMGID